MASNLPDNFLDGFMNTVWVARCCPCAPYEAHVGGDFGEPELVRCAKIWQAKNYYSSEIVLSKEGTTTGLQGNLWVRIFPNIGRTVPISIQYPDREDCSHFTYISSPFHLLHLLPFLFEFVYELRLLIIEVVSLNDISQRHLQVLLTQQVSKNITYCY